MLKTTNPLSRFHVAEMPSGGSINHYLRCSYFPNEANGYTTTLLLCDIYLTGDLTLINFPILLENRSRLMTDGAGYTYWGTVAR